MKALILDGTRHDKQEESCRRAVNSIGQELASAGYEVNNCILSDKAIASCRGCFGCWVVTPGECVTRDDGNEIARSFMNSDLVVYFTPITFGGFSSPLKRAVDRLIPNVLPFFIKREGEIHHPMRYQTYPKMNFIGLATESNPETERIFRELCARMALNLDARGSNVLVVSSGQETDGIKSWVESFTGNGVAR